MIGFQPSETYLQEYSSKLEDQTSKPGEKEVPSVKPDIEIPEPNPSSVPNPQPDTIENNPLPEIRTIPSESPIPSTAPEILPVQPVEYS